MDALVSGLVIPLHGLAARFRLVRENACLVLELESQNAPVRVFRLPLELEPVLVALFPPLVPVEDVA